MNVPVDSVALANLIDTWTEVGKSLDGFIAFCTLAIVIVPVCLLATYLFFGLFDRKK